MTTEGWIFMIAGWSSIITLTGYCFFKVYKAVKKQNNNESQ